MNIDIKKLSILLIGAIVALHFVWMSDDAYVTFRYIQNLVAGNGLVYNVGEYVEGFTHPLWLFMLVPLQYFLSLETASLLLGIGAFLVMLYVLIERNMGVVAIILLSCFDFVIWASGGLETMMISLFILLAYFSYRDKQWNKMAWFLTVIALLRPDGMIFLIVFTVFMSIFSYKNAYINDTAFTNFKNYLKLYYPYITILGYFIFRILYYGEIVPNTYFVKAQGLNIEQGLSYLLLHVQIFWPIIFVFIFGLIAHLHDKKFYKSFLNDNKEILIISFLYILYILKVGGDFMFFRFFVPILPLWIIMILKLFQNKTIGVFVLSSLFIFSWFMLRQPILLDENGRSHFVNNIVDERQAYQDKVSNGLTFMENEIKLGKMANKIFEGFDNVRILNRGQCAFSYYMNPEYVLESMGLCDKVIPRDASKFTSTRPSHRYRVEKDYILEKKCNFIFNRNTAYTGVCVSFFNRLYGEVIYWDTELMNALKEKYGDNMRVFKKVRN